MDYPSNLSKHPFNQINSQSKRATGSFNLKSLDFMKKEVEKSIRLVQRERERDVGREGEKLN